MNCQCEWEPKCVIAETYCWRQAPTEEIKFCQLFSRRLQFIES